MTHDDIRARVIRLGKQYGIMVTETDWNRTYIGRHLGWHVDLQLSPGQHAIACLRKDRTVPQVEYAWGTEVFPATFTYEDFQLVFERAARSMGYTRTILRVVK